MKCSLDLFRHFISMSKYYIFHVIIILGIFKLNYINTAIHPGSTYDLNETSCDEFSKFARFNPYTVIWDEWMVFYYWGPAQSPMFAIFFVPTTVQKNYIKFFIDDHVPKPINWTARMLIMRERDNSTYLLVEQNDRGHYLLYEPLKGLATNDVVEAVDIRIRQTGDGKYFGIMDCKQNIVYLLSRIKDVPKKNKIQDEAARFGYRARGGKSYLYQGHQWMPIPEAEDEDFESAMKYKKEVFREN